MVAGKPIPVFSGPMTSESAAPHVPKVGDWVALRALYRGNYLDACYEQGRFTIGDQHPILPMNSIIGPAAPPEEPKTPGRVAYEAHRRLGTDYQRWTTWDELPPGVRAHWEAVAAAVLGARG